MRLTTADIKDLIQEYASDGKEHTIKEFKEYIALKRGTDFSQGQFSGAVFQLSDRGILESVNRGVYVMNDSAIASIVKKPADDSLLTKESVLFREKVVRCLSEMNERLAVIVNETDVWELDNSGFELLREVKQLSELLNKMRML